MSSALVIDMEIILSSTFYAQPGSQICFQVLIIIATLPYSYKRRLVLLVLNIKKRLEKTRERLLFQIQAETG